MSRFSFIATSLLLLLPAVPARAEPAIVPEAMPNHAATFLAFPAKKSMPCESELLSDLADGQLDHYQLFEAALIIGSPGSYGSGDTLKQRWQEILIELRTVSSPSESTPEIATDLLRFMHKSILTGQYSADCNALQRTLSDGDYNCVTATILYCCLANQCGLPVKAVSVPGHVRCRLVENPPYPIETTDPDWTARRQAMDQDSPAGQQGTGQQGRLLSPVQLLAKLYYNRGLVLLSQRQYEEALAATELSWQLDPYHEAAGENVATVINNWALVLCAEGHFSQSLQLLSRGQQLVPEHPILYANQAHILDCWARHRNDTSGP